MLDGVEGEALEATTGMQARPSAVAAAGPGRRAHLGVGGPRLGTLDTVLIA
jgi:hypothetical protein